MSGKKASEMAITEEDFIVEDEIDDNQSDDDVPVISLPKNGQSANESLEAVSDEITDKHDQLSDDGLQVEDEIITEDEEKNTIEKFADDCNQSFDDSQPKLYALEKIQDTNDFDMSEPVEACSGPGSDQSNRKLEHGISLDDFEVVDEVEEMVVHEEVHDDAPAASVLATEPTDVQIVAVTVAVPIDEPKPQPCPSVSLSPKEVASGAKSPKRTEPVLEVADFVREETSRVFDWVEASCFYCFACQDYCVSLLSWEEHTSDVQHKKNLKRWRTASSLSKELCVYNPENQKKLQAVKSFIVGGDKIVELVESDDKSVFLCLLCNFLATRLDCMLAHMTQLEHIDNYAEHVTSHVFKPPTLSSLAPQWTSSGLRPLDARGEREVLDEARRSFLRYGRGRIRTLRDRTDRRRLLAVSSSSSSDGEGEKAALDDLLARAQLAHALHQLHVKQVKIDVLTQTWSAANKELQAMARDRREGVVGLHHLVELWAPSRRAPAVWHCALCDELLLDWPQHCASSRHLLLYLRRDYGGAAVLERLVLRAGSVAELRALLTTTARRLVQFEARASCVKYVVQVHRLREVDSFVVVNSRLCRQIMETSGFKFEPVASNTDKFLLDEESADTPKRDSRGGSRSSSASAKSAGNREKK